MDDLNGFERRLGMGLEGLAGPRHPVDALSVARTAERAASVRRWHPRYATSTRFAALVAGVAFVGVLLVVGGQPNPSVVSSGSGAPPAPSADPAGQMVLFARSGTAASDATPLTLLYVMRADGTGIRQLTDYHPSLTLPSWSPDGTRIEFSDEWGVVVLDVTTGRAARLPLMSDQCNAPTWTPDSRTIVLATGPTGAVAPCGSQDGTGTFTPDLLFMPSDGSHDVVRSRWSGHGPTPVFPDYPLSAPSWSPDGRHLAFACRDDLGAGLCVADVNATAPSVTYESRRISEPDALQDADSYMSPRWSPDGSEILATIRGPGRTQSIVAIPADGGPTRTIAANAAFDERMQANWSPDGTRIAYSGLAQDRGHHGAAWVVDSDGGMPMPVVALTGICPPDWSPDGTRLTGRGFVQHLTIASLGGQQPVVGPDLAGLGKICPLWQPRPVPLASVFAEVPALE